MSTPHDQLRATLESIGFHSHESRIYLDLLQHGQQAASVVARRTQTPRSTIRSILDKLCTRGVVGKVYQGNTQRYFCLPPQALQQSVQADIQTQTARLDLISAASLSLR